MADQDFELPPGYTYAPPDVQPDAPGVPSAPPQGDALPSGYTYAPAGSQPDAPGAVPPYQGHMLPWRTDAGGNRIFDPLHSGITGAAWDAFTLPGDVLTGRQPTPYTGGSTTSHFYADPNNPLYTQPNFNPDPTLLSRSTNLAAFATPPQLGRIATSAAVPTAKEISAASTAGYEAARAADMTVPVATINDMATQLRTTIQNQYGSIPAIAPKTNAILDQLANPPVGGGNWQANYTGLEAARRAFQGIAKEGGSDGFAAQQVIPELDKQIDAISPEAKDARANYAAAQRSSDITGQLSGARTGIQERAEAAAEASGSGANLDNALRQRLKAFSDNPDNMRGFNDAEKAAFDSFIQGGFTRNMLRTVSNVLGGGGGLGRLAASTAGAYLGGKTGLGEVGVALGASLPPTIGASLKGIQNALATRQMGLIDDLIRSRSPLAQQMQQQGGPGFAPGYYPVQPLIRYTTPTPNPQMPMTPPGQFPALPPTGPGQPPLPAGLLGPWA